MLYISVWSKYTKEAEAVSESVVLLVKMNTRGIWADTVLLMHTDQTFHFMATTCFFFYLVTDTELNLFESFLRNKIQA